ncbi:hypothetical protein AAD018_006050 [Aestuariibius insulae]|uniref:hypothetical protein n=1 Tax=Aestuariibius insulae TaxID=2058287 RepID=UPI00345E7932
MPEDTPKQTPSFALTTQTENASFAGIPASVQTMSTWKYEHWESPEYFSEFPLLDICQNAPEFFAESGHFTNKDMKTIAGLMGVTFDPNKPADLYKTLILRAQKAPWIFPILETVVMQKRGTQKGPRAKKAAMKKGVIARLPLSKLRLEAHAELQDRVHELLLDDLSPEIAVASFCEYAVMNYYHVLSEPDSFERVHEEAMEILTHRGPTDWVEQRLPEIDEDMDWGDIAADILDLIKAEPDACSTLILGHLHTAIRGLAEELQIGSVIEVQRISLIADLSVAARDMQDFLTEEISEEVEIRLRTLGAIEEGDDIDRIASPTAGILLSDQFYNLILSRKEKISTTTDQLEAIGNEIAEATAAKKFALIGELATQAEKLENKINRMEEAYQAILDIFRSLGDPTPDRFMLLLENYDPAQDADTFDENSDPSDYLEIFDKIREQGLLQVQSDNPNTQEEVERADESTENSSDEVAERGNRAASAEFEATSTEEATSNLDIQPADVEPAEDPAVDEYPAPNDKAHGPQTETEGNEDNEADHQNSAEQHDKASDLSVHDQLQTQPEQLEAAASQSLQPAPVDKDVFASLIERDFIAIAANAAAAYEHEGMALPLPAVALRVAAASRASYRGFGPDLHKFNEHVGNATSTPLSDLASVLILGSILRPAILSKDTTLRTQVSDLCKGTLGQHLIEVNDTVSRLSFDYPPSPDRLAELSGQPGTPEKQRLTDRLERICKALSQKKSRWPFATELMHYIVSLNGELGAAVQAISRKDPTAPKLARAAVKNLRDTQSIEAFSETYAAERGYNDLALYSKGVEYLARQFDEPVALLKRWVETTQSAAANGQQSEERTRLTTATLRTQLKKAGDGLEAEVGRTDDPLIAAVAYWISEQINETRDALLGRDTGRFSTLEDALYAEMDLLPPVDRDELSDSEERADIYTRILNENQILGQEDAIKRACAEGAFDSAYRMVDQFDVSSDKKVREAVMAFVADWRPEVENRNRMLTALDKVDFKNQEQISRQLTWCKLTLEKIDGLAAGSEVHDIAGITERLAVLDQTIADIELSIRDGQISRINEYRKPENEDDVETLLNKIDELTIEALEDRIAQLRDGRSAAVFETDLQGLIWKFTPEFLPFASSDKWPADNKAFEEATATEGNLLFAEEDRRAAAVNFIVMYRDLMLGMRTKKATHGQIKALFEEIGFEQVNVSKIEELGRKGSWTGTLHTRIVSDGWFLPPVFGSNATSGYNFVVASPETLPETMIKAIGDSSRPAIIFLSGVADASRRREIAERLRSKAIPALLIDEALIAFAATRRETRARTVFECGLPYGRIDPYTTDAGQLPPEMFFGREGEVHKIIAKTADGCLVYGGRQLGKSALLAHIAQTQHDDSEKRFFVNREIKALGISEKTSEIWRHISNMLPDDIVKPDHTSVDLVSRDIQAWVNRHPNGRIICMFDEADNFITQDTRDDYPQLSKLKELMEKTQRAFKVVFAGLHNVQRMNRQPNSPLWHLGEPICIGPLNQNIDDKRAAFDLVVSPMRAAGFAFENMQAVEEILTWANYYPSLVQEYMKGLLSTMHGVGSGKTYKLPAGDPLWTIPSNTLFAHRGFEHIETRIREKFHLTLNLDPRYALVAYTLARLIYEGDERRALITGLPTRLLMEEASLFWPKTSEAPTLPSFEALLEELFDLGVLGRNPVPGSENRYNYLLRTREVAAMLGTGNDIYHALDEIENKDPTINYDSATHRKRYSAAPKQPENQWPYSPLSDFHMERLISNTTEDPVQIICGLEVLGIGKVSQALRRIAEAGTFPGARDDKIIVQEAASANDLRRIVDKARAEIGKRNIVVYEAEEPTEAKLLLDLLARRTSVLNKSIRPVITISASNPDLRALAIRRREQTQFLTPWGAEMIRVHLDKLERTDLDSADLRSTILAKTGGIPSEVTGLISAMIASERPSEEAKNWEAKPNLPSGFLSDTVGVALWVLSEDGDFNTKNDILRENTGTDFESIGPDLQATGLVARSHDRKIQYRLTALGQLIAASVDL